MCLPFPSSRSYQLDSDGREPQFCYVRKRVGGRVVSRDIMRRDQLRSRSRVPRAVKPRRSVSATTEKGASSHHEVAMKNKSASPRQLASTKPNKTRTQPEKKDGVPSWDTWGDENENGNKSSEQDQKKASGDWALHDLYIEKDDTKQNDSDEKQTNGAKGGKNGGNMNDKGSKNKRVASNPKTEKDQDDNAVPEWDTKENKGDTSDSNENTWAPADADWKCEEGWESGPNGTTNENKPEGNTDTWNDWDASPEDNKNQSEEHDSTKKVPGAWPDRENDSEKDSSAKVENDQTVQKKNKQQASQKKETPKGSKKPRVKGKGGNATIEFCVCEADNSVSFKSAKYIQENCQPGEWQQDEHGNPFFQRAQEEENIDDNQVAFAEIQNDNADAGVVW